MANDVTDIPMIFDTDFASFQGISGAPKKNVRVRRMVLSVGAGGVSSAGTVSIAINAAGSRLLYPPMTVAAGIAANQILVTDGPWTWDDTLTWPDFAVTGLTATATRLFVWLRTN